MRFACELKQLPTGSWLVRYLGSDLGAAAVTGESRSGALEKMRKELRYRLEYCPCSGELYQDATIELVVRDAQ